MTGGYRICPIQHHLHDCISELSGATASMTTTSNNIRGYVNLLRKLQKMSFPHIVENKDERVIVSPISLFHTLLKSKMNKS